MTDLAYPWNAIALVNRDSLELDPRVMAAILAYVESNIEIPEPASTFPPLAADIIGLGSNMPRASATANSIFNISGQINFSYITVAKDGSCPGPIQVTGSTPGSGLTFYGFALYSVDGAGNLTKITETAHLGATVASNALQSPNWSVAPTLSIGDRVALGALYVGTNTPSQRGVTLAGTGMLSTTPYLTRQLGGQTGFPASVSAASLQFLSTGVPYCALRES